MLKKILNNYKQIKTYFKNKEVEKKYLTHKQNLINIIQNQKSSPYLLESIENTQESLK
ncbi:MAG: hypothetical protein HRU03_05865, partial [Nanoarchaeales archaeon]|nr:hypothetical protein [Nanoarchaeales archaeon]